MIARGIVENINWKAGEDWTDGTVNVSLLAGPGMIEAAYVSDWPPPPRSRVVLEQVAGGQWIVLGVEGGRRVVLHDDFMHSGGDGNWASVVTPLTGAGVGLIAPETSADAAPRAAGSVKVTAVRVSGAAASAELRKNAPIATAAGLPVYFCARVLPIQITTCQLQVGLMNVASVAAPYNIISLTTSMSASWLLGQDDTGAGGFTGFTDTNVTPSSARYDVVEMIVMPSGFLYAYINGLGPFFYQGLPFQAVAGNNYAPWIRAVATSVGHAEIRVDYVHVEILGSVEPVMPGGRTLDQVVPAGADTAGLSSDPAGLPYILATEVDPSDAATDA